MEEGNVEKVVRRCGTQLEVVSNLEFHENGRILLLWNSELVNVQTVFKSAQVIHVLVSSKVSQMEFYFSLVYAFNSPEDRVSLWQEIEAPSAQINIPWLIGGDFNTTMMYGERMTGGELVDADTDKLVNIASSCCL